MVFHRQRQEERTVIAVDAMMACAMHSQPALLANASSRGVLALVAAPPERGTRVRLIVGDSELVGQVRWRGSGRCGIALRDRIDVASLEAGRVVPVKRLATVHARDSYRGPSGLLRTIISDVPPSTRTGHALLLTAALAGAIMALSRISRAVMDFGPLSGATTYFGLD